MRSPRVLVTGAVVLITLALAASVAGAALGRVETANKKRLTKQVAATVTATYPDLPITKTTCKKLKLKVGAVALCDVTAGGLALQIQVTANDKKGNVTIASTQAVIPKQSAEDLVRNNATLPAQVDCGPEPFHVRAPGAPIVCTATFDDGTTQQVAVTPSDVAGSAAVGPAP